MEININDKINLLYDYIYNQNTENCFSLEKIVLGKIGLDDIKLTIPEISNEEEINYYELIKSDILNGKFKIISFDEETKQLYLKKYSNQFSVSIKVSFYDIKHNVNDLFSSPINNDSLFSYILSELVLNRKTKHLVIPINNIDIKISEIEKIIGDDNYYNKIKNLIKNNIIQDVCCLQLRECFFKSNNLHDYLKENKCVYKELLFQIIHTLAVLQKEFIGFRHNNLTLKNIFVYLKKNDNVNIEYDGFKNDKFYLPNLGFDIKISNFEKSVIPKYYEIEKTNINNYYDLYTFMNDLISFETINECDKETTVFFDKYIPVNIRNNFKKNIELIKPIDLIYDKYFDDYRKKLNIKKEIFNNHQYLTGKSINTYIDSDNHSILGKQHKIKSMINIMPNKRVIKKDIFSSKDITRVESFEVALPIMIGGYEKAPYTTEKNTPFISNDERTIQNKKKEENPTREPPVLLEQKIYDTSKRKSEKKNEFPPPYIPLYDQNTGDVTAQMLPYSNLIGQPAVQQKVYNITLSNPIGHHSTINRIYEDMIPGEPRIYSSLTIYERNQLTNFIRNTIIDNHDGEDMDITGGKNSLLSFIKVMDCNPYATKQNPYHDLPRDFLLYRAAYPIRYNEDNASIEIAKKSMGMNVRMYRMSIGAMKCRSISSKINAESFDLWREIFYYDWVKDNLIKKKVSPNFVSSYLYKIDTKSRIDWDKLQQIKNKVQIESVTDSLVNNQKKINAFHTLKKTLGELSLILPKNDYNQPETNIKLSYKNEIIKIEEKRTEQIKKINSSITGAKRDHFLKLVEEDYIRNINSLKLIYKNMTGLEEDDDITLDSGKVLILLTEAPTTNILTWSGPIYETFGTIRKMISTGYHTPEVWKSILFQLVYACAVLQEANILIENFSLENNVFIKDIFTDYNSIGSWIYKVNNIDYYIPNYGYILMIDSKFADVDTTKNIKEQQFKIYGDIYTNNSIYDPVKIKTKIIEQFKNVINPDNFTHKLVVDGGGKIDSDIIDFIKRIYNNTNINIASLIPEYFSEFVHNKVGSLLLKSERENINKFSRPNFNRGNLMVYFKKYEEYEWVIYIEDSIKPKCKRILTKDRNKYIVIDVFYGSLFGYPENETILPDSKKNMKYDENNIYETYNLDNIKLD
jgi:hypothetical protein